MEIGAPLNPAQQAVIALLGKGSEPSAPLPEDLADRLLTALDDALGPLVDQLDPADPLWVSKHALQTVHACEANHVATKGDFSWTVPAARGAVAHKAIELTVHWQGEAIPGELVDEAIARLIENERGVASFLGSLSPGERAELRGMAVDQLTKFQECFPSLKAAWVPVTESRAQVELVGGCVVLGAKTDLTLGRPGVKVVIDLKSGRASPAHREDLRFYALVETLRLGVAPRKLATYYLDAARAEVEDVAEGTLVAALRRTVDGVLRMAALAEGSEPRKRPGPVCRWCPISVDCPEGRAELQRRDDPDAEGW